MGPRPDRKPTPPAPVLGAAGRGWRASGSRRCGLAPAGSARSARSAGSRGSAGSLGAAVLAAWVALVSLGGLAGCGGGGGEPGQNHGEAGPTFALVVFNRLGPDWPAEAMPRLEEVAVGGERGRVPVGSGSAAAGFAALLTGWPPEAHGLRSSADRGAERLHPGVPRLAEQFRRAGGDERTATVAALGSPRFDEVLCGFGAGFDVWAEAPATHPRRPRGPAATARALLAALDGPARPGASLWLVLELASPPAGELGPNQLGPHLTAAFRALETAEPSLAGELGEVSAGLPGAPALGAEAAEALLELAARRRGSAAWRVLEEARRRAEAAALDQGLGELLDGLAARGRTGELCLLVVGLAPAPGPGDPGGGAPAAAWVWQRPPGGPSAGEPRSLADLAAALAQAAGLSAQPPPTVGDDLLRLRSAGPVEVLLRSPEGALGQPLEPSPAAHPRAERLLATLGEHPLAVPLARRGAAIELELRLDGQPLDEARLRIGSRPAAELPLLRRVQAGGPPWPAAEAPAAELESLAAGWWRLSLPGDGAAWALRAAGHDGTPAQSRPAPAGQAPAEELWRPDGLLVRWQASDVEGATAANEPRAVELRAPRGGPLALALERDGEPIPLARVRLAGEQATRAVGPSLSLVLAPGENRVDAALFGPDPGPPSSWGEVRVWRDGPRPARLGHGDPAAHGAARRLLESLPDPP